MAKRTVPSWVYEMIDGMSPQELQKGIGLTKATRIDFPSDTEWPFKVVMAPKTIRGTQIPAMTFARFKSRQWLPGPTTIKKLLNFKHRINYQRLKAAGASVKEAKRLYKSKDVQEQVEYYRHVVKTISENKSVEPANIVYGLNQSYHSVDYWEQYIKSQKYKPPTSGDEESDEDWEDYIAGEDHEGEIE